MKRKRFTEEQILEVLKQAEAGAKTADLCRQAGITEQTLYRWKSRYGGMQVSEARRLRDLESENARLKKLLAEAHLDNAALTARGERPDGAEPHPVIVAWPESIKTREGEFPGSDE